MTIADQPFNNISLLYPTGSFSQSQAASTELSPAVWHELGLEQVVAAFTGNRDHQKEIRKTFARLVHDPEVLQYRQQILEDFLTHPTLVGGFAALLPVIDIRQPCSPLTTSPLPANPWSSDCSASPRRMPGLRRYTQCPSARSKAPMFP